MCLPSTKSKMVASEILLQKSAAQVGVLVPNESRTAYVEMLREMDRMCQHVIDTPGKSRSLNGADERLLS